MGGQELGDAGQHQVGAGEGLLDRAADHRGEDRFGKFLGEGGVSPAFAPRFSPWRRTIVRLTAPRSTEPDRSHAAEPASEPPRDRQEDDAALQRNAP